MRYRLRTLLGKPPRQIIPIIHTAVFMTGGQIRLIADDGPEIQLTAHTIRMILAALDAGDRTVIDRASGRLRIPSNPDPVG